MVPALVFDLDGTLVDSLPGIAAALNAALRDHHLPGHPDRRVRDFIGSGTFMLCRRAVPSSAPDDLVREVEDRFKRHYADGWPLGSSLYPGIARLIRRLADDGTRLGVLSNKPDGFTREMVDHLFPGRPFSFVRGQIDGAPRKPDPAALLPLLSARALAPADTRLIGDSTIDRDTARAAGVPFIGVAWGYHSPDLLGSRVARSAAELAELLTAD